MPQILRLIVWIAVIAAIGIGIYYWMANDEGVEQIQQPAAPIEELDRP